MSKIAQTAIIHPGVKLGRDIIIEDYCIIGIQPVGQSDAPAETIIGDGAVIRAHSIIYSGNCIGSSFQTGNRVNIRESNWIGDNVSIGTGSVVEHHVKIGHGARIHSLAFIPEFTIIEEGAWIGPNVVLTNSVYPKSPGSKNNLAGPLLRKNCKVGANTTVLPGVEIGSDSLVGAGSLVSKDVPSGTLSYGHPSVARKSIKELPYVRDEQ